MAVATIASDRQLVRNLRRAGIRARTWRNRGEYAPPADISFRNTLRIHTGGRAVEVDISGQYHQAVITPTTGRYKGQSFLVGMDEVALFVSRLPERVSTVDEAHEVLRPAEVPEGTPRQGEWFFMAQPQCACGKAFDAPDHKVDIVSNLRLGGTSHQADRGYSHRGKTYVQGMVQDTRAGHHEPLAFPSWTEAIRNRELVIEKEPERPNAARRYD